MLGHKVALGAALLTALQFVMKFIDVIVLVVMARLLTPADFGLVALALSAMAVIGAVTELSVSEVLVQREALEPGDIDTAFTLNILRGVLVMLVILASAFPLAALYQDDRLILIMCALSLTPFISGLSSPALVHFLRRLEYRPTAKLQIIGRLGGIMASVAIAYTTGSYWALIASQLASQLITAAWSYRIAPYWPKFRLKGARDIINFAGWMVASRVIGTVNLQSDRFLVGYVLGKAQLGQYTLGSDIAALTTYSFASPILQTMFGGFSRLQGEAQRMRAAYLKGQQMLVLVILPLGIGLSVIADRLVPLLLGPNWDAAISVISWLAPMISLQALYLPLLSLAMAMARPRTLAERESINLIMRLPVTLAGAWYFGLIGAVIARALSGIVVILLTLALARRFIQISVWRQITNVWRSMTGVLVMAGGVELLKLAMPPEQGVIAQTIEIAVLVGVGGLLYVGTHLGLWMMAGRPDGAEQFIFNLIKRRGKAPQVGPEAA